MKEKKHFGTPAGHRPSPFRGGGVRPLSSYKNERGTTGPHSIARWNGAGDTRVLGGVPTLVCPPLEQIRKIKVGMNRGRKLD